MAVNHSIREKYELLRGVLNERQRRLWAAVEARLLGRGGLSAVAKATGLSPHTIRAGLRELESLEQGEAIDLEPERVRQAGAGRKPHLVKDPSLLEDLESLLEPANRGEVRSPLSWTCESTAQLAGRLRTLGHVVSPRLVARLLLQLGYRLFGTRKSADTTKQPDRGEQFAFVNEQVEDFHRRGHPVVAAITSRRSPTPDVDATAEKEKAPEEPSSTTADHAQSAQRTADFVRPLLSYWWKQLIRICFPDSRELLLVADFAGLRGRIGRIWKLALQDFADETNLTLTICHFPPGTTRFNRVEQVLTSQLQFDLGSQLVQQQVTAQLIGSMSSAAGMVLRPEFEQDHVMTALPRDPRFGSLLLEPASFLGAWNYTIRAHSGGEQQPSGQTAS
jgi:hypothetical protein